VRFNSAADARRALLSKRLALARCRQIQASFPPFDQSRRYRVSDHSPISPLRLNRVRLSTASSWSPLVASRSPHSWFGDF